MFRKHAALAAVVLLAATIPTRGDGYATYQDSVSTRTGANATHKASLSTSGPVFAGISFSGATASPQQVSAGGERARRSSTGHDYTTQSLSAQEQTMLNLLNSDRKNGGLAALTHDPALSRIARIKSEDMRDGNYFAHESPTWGDVRAMLRAFGYSFSGASENIAHHANVDKAQAAFLSSPGHRANIMSAAWTKVGIGICFDRDGFIYATQIFAR